MKSPRLLRTSAFRLALRYALLYAALVALALSALYLAISRFVDAELAAGLQSTMSALASAHEAMRADELGALIQAELRAGAPRRLHLALVDAAGRPVAGDIKGWPDDLTVNDQVRSVRIDDELIPGRAPDEDAYWPAIGRRFSNGDQLLVAYGLDEAEDLLDYIEGIILAILGISVALAMGLGLLQGRALLLRVDDLIEAARAVGSGRLNRRIPLSGQGDEIDELAGQLNAMLERIAALIDGMRQVTDNVAHDLRSPLSRVRNLLEVTTRESREPGEYREAVIRAVADLEQIIHTFNALVEIAEAESGSFRGDWGALDLSALAAELGQLYADLAEDQGGQLELEILPGLTVIGNRHLLAQAISNLLDNALKFSPRGGSLRLRVARHSDQVFVSVSDSGPGIPPEERERVLQRFVRLDAARSTSGNGLGLSLVAAVARLHGAALALGDARPGLEARLTFSPVPNHRERT